MKKEVAIVDAKPSKRIYRAIIADYDLKRSICELIDNALDLWVRNDKKKLVLINVDINLDQQTIKITDNVGGLRKEELKVIVSPGETSNSYGGDTIGFFGVGSKRAVVALAEQIKILTRHSNEIKTHSIEYNDDWLKDDTDWNLPAYEDIDIEKGTTIIELVKLRYLVTQEMINGLQEHLCAVYARFLLNSNVKILLNNIPLIPIVFENWAYPPSYLPQENVFSILTTNYQKIEVSILSGLTDISSPATGEYGVYFYMNDRLIARALKNPNVGFGTGEVGQPHPSASLARVIVSLQGPAELMPWNSSKSEINYNSEVFIKIRKEIVEALSTYAKISRGLASVWNTEIFPFKTGKPIKNTLGNINDVKHLTLPEVPRTRFRYEEIVSGMNKIIVKDKPWARGLYESIIAANIIYNKKNLIQKNRIVLLLLDSTIEIALKEYLVNESGTYYSDTHLDEIFRTRKKVMDEVVKYTANNSKWERIWKQVAHYNGLRNQLIHRRTSINITDEDIDNYRNIVEKVLDHLFGLKFKKQI